MAGLSGIGLIKYTPENNAFRLWIPEDSAFVDNYQWLLKNYPPNVRYNNIILAKSDGGDVLQPQVLQYLSQIQNGVRSKIVAGSENKTWTDLCKK